MGVHMTVLPVHGTRSEGGKKGEERGKGGREGRRNGRRGEESRRCEDSDVDE